MTVLQLRAILANVSDDAEVFIDDCEFGTLPVKVAEEFEDGFIFRPDE